MVVKWVWSLVLLPRQLAKKQLIRFRNNVRFQWVDMSQRTGLSNIADMVWVWFNNDHTPFPTVLDGTSLKTLVMYDS